MINASNDFELVLLSFNSWKIEFLFPQLRLNAFENGNFYFFDYNRNWINSRFARVERQYWQMIITIFHEMLMHSIFWNRDWNEWDTEKRAIQNRKTVFIYFHKLFHFILSIAFSIPMLNDSHSILRMLYFFFQRNSILFSSIACWIILLHTWTIWNESKRSFSIRGSMLMQ